MLGNDELQDSVAQKLEALIIEIRPMRLVSQTRMSEGLRQKERVPELVADSFFERIHPRRMLNPVRKFSNSLLLLENLDRSHQVQGTLQNGVVDTAFFRIRFPSLCRLHRLQLGVRPRNKRRFIQMRPRILYYERRHPFFATRLKHFAFLRP